MYLQEILEVAIGLVFVWLVISVATMSLQEWFGNILNTRAKELEKAIAQMLSSPNMTSQFYEHPLIANLYKPSQKSRKKRRGCHPISRPINSARPCFRWSSRPGRTIPLSGQ